MDKRQFSLQNNTLSYFVINTTHNLNNRFAETIIDVNKDAKIGINLNHS